MKWFKFTWKELHPPEWEHSDHSVEHKPSWSHRWNHHTPGLSLASASALCTEGHPTVAASSRFGLDTQFVIFIQYTCSLKSVGQKFWNQSFGGLVNHRMMGGVSKGIGPRDSGKY